MKHENQQLVPDLLASPESWPDEPRDLTYSTLTEIETCPRRWALSMASYPSVWNERGYPQKLNIGALSGIVVHNVLETVTKELATSGCASVLDPSAVSVMQRLGGLTKIIERAIEQVTVRVSINPRVSRQTEYFTRSLRAQSSELRGKTQRMLSRRTDQSESSGTRIERAFPNRGPLRSGVYPELELRIRRLSWKGRVDLLALTNESCVITDFKTGDPSEEHRSQICIYSLLWYQDDELNPNRRLATKLILTYQQGDVEIAAPTADELSALEAEIVSRGEAARQAIANRPPEARPKADNCRFCSVRHLCDEYWTSQVHSTDQSGQFVDAEIQVISRHGPKM